jgi:predicted transposase YbfD/YdcC
MSCCLLHHFKDLADPRIERNKLHALEDIVVLTICATVSGADGWESIADFGRSKLDWLRQFIALKNGVPSPDCIAYVLQRLSVEGFMACFRNWTQAVMQASGGQVQEFVRVDGKTSRGSRDRRKGRSPLHMVSAWASRNRMVLGQEATEEKSNEITAIPKLLLMLELKGCIVSIDAMGCQRAIAEQIIEQGGDYVLGLKDNQPSLSEAVEEFFETAQAADFAGVKYDQKEELDKGHGRVETRRYWITEELSTLPKPERWKGLRSIGMVVREVLQGGERTEERRYFINSIPAQANLFAEAVRGHWDVENRLHWRMDVVLREDACTIRKGNAPAILTTARHLVLNLFEREGSRLSLPRKRYRAALDDDYRAKVVFGV